MKFAESIFGKKINQITFEDFKEFFSIEREESSKMEFKSGEVEIEDIYREVSAFLNSEGGILLIGTPREQKIEINKKNFKRVCKGELIPSKFRNKGWITQKMAVNISPYPSNIEIQEILTDDGNYFILDIPQSTIPPHQCLNEGKYYIRLEEEAKPASHGIVQSLFFTRQKPKINTTTNISRNKDESENRNEILINLFNETEIPTDNISYIITVMNVESIISERHHQNSYGFRKDKNDNFIIQNNIKEVLIKGVSVPIEFLIEHKNQPFLIRIIVWAKDFGMYEDSYIWDPVKFEFIDGYKTGDGKNYDSYILGAKLEEILKKQSDI